MRRFLTGTAALVGSLLSGPAWAQCAMCQTALTSSPEGRAMLAPLSHGILLLLAAPYLLVASCALLIFRHRLRQALPDLVARALLRPVRPHLQ